MDRQIGDRHHTVIEQTENIVERTVGLGNRLFDIQLQKHETAAQHFGGKLETCVAINRCTGITDARTNYNRQLGIRASRVGDLPFDGKHDAARSD